MLSDDVLIKDIDIKDKNTLNQCVNVIKQSFITVRNDLKLTIENCPTHPSFINVDDLKKLGEKDVKFYGVFLNSTMIGLYVIENGGNGYYYIEKLSVLPEYRHNGYGKKMMQHAINYMNQKNARGISVAIVNEQKVLKDWYSSFGFKETSKREFDHLPFTVCFMELNNEK